MISMQQHYMLEAIALAEIAIERDEVPVGAVIVDSRNNQIISRSFNQVESGFDPVAHAEILAIKKACEILQTTRLEFCDLFVTLEPCAMCASAISHSKIRRLYFGAYDIKGGAVENGVRFFESRTCHHSPEVYGGILQKESSKLLKDFFKTKRR
jgi:tRNA(adenine34) deaminase